MLRAREKLDGYNTVDDAVDLIRKSKKIMVLTGAGVSVRDPDVVWYSQHDADFFSSSVRHHAAFPIFEVQQVFTRV